MRIHAFVMVALTGFALTAGSAAYAAGADPTMQEIYQTAEGGHLDKAQEMIAQVLRDHPKSGKAHYVAAELDSRQDNLAGARAELAQAEQYDPGLPFARPAAVQELRAELRGDSQVVRPVRAASSVPWGAILVLLGVIAVVWMFLRRRSAPVAYSGGVGGVPGTYGGGPGYGGPGMGAPMGGGLGSNIAGGLAGGLAAGAGIVAGEEIAHHFLDGGAHPQGGVIPPAAAEEEPPNEDMGGNDFGVNDPGSWDDSGGGDSGGGGGDWN